MSDISTLNLDGQSFNVFNVDRVYPVGSIYMSVNSTDPGTLFGGTWTRIKDTFLLSSGDTYTAGDTGGEATHVLTVDELPAHTHGIYSGYGDIGDPAVSSDGYRYQWWGGHNRGWHDGGYYGAGPKGNDQPHNNLPPYLVVNVWQRTA